MIKRQTITAVICAILAITLGIVYFFVVTPALVPKPEKVTPIELIDPLERRTADQKRVYMFPSLERSQIKKIEVYNDKGGYTFYKKSGKNETFVLDGMEKAPYNTWVLNYIIGMTRAPVANARYTGNIDYSVYGLDEGNEKRACLVITDDSDNVHRIWVGNKASSGGYYCRYDTRNAVYLLDPAGFDVVFSDVNSILTPSLALPVDEKQYAGVTVLAVYKNGSPLMRIKTVYDYDKNGNITSWDFDFDMAPLKNFLPDENVRTDLINKVSVLTGTKVIAYGPEETTAKTLKDDYGIDLNNPYYGIYYQKFASDYQSLEDVYIFFSKPNKEGISNAYTTLYGGMVVTIPASSIPLYKYDTVNYISPFLDMTTITKISKIEIKDGIHPDKDGVVINTAYGIKSASVDGGELSVQSVWHIGTGEYLSSDRVDNFKKIYADFVVIQPMGEIDVSKIEDEDHIASVTIHYADGTAKTFDFYAYTSTRCYYTINGELTKNYTFSVSRDNVDKLIRDVYNFEQGYTLN